MLEQNKEQADTLETDYGSSVYWNMSLDIPLRTEERSHIACYMSWNLLLISVLSVDPKSIGIRLYQ